MTGTPQDFEQFARVQLEAARKNLYDCKERENIAFENYMAAIEFSASAFKREHLARCAWISALRNAADNTEESAS